MFRLRPIPALPSQEFLMSLPSKSRRGFFGQAGLMTAAASVWDSSSRADEPGDQRPVVVGVMGRQPRFVPLAEVFGRLPGVEVRYVCDVDQNRVQRCRNLWLQSLRNRCGPWAIFDKSSMTPQLTH